MKETKKPCSKAPNERTYFKQIIENINSAIGWAMDLGMTVIYIKHSNLSPGTRTFKPDTKGAELVPELKIVSDHIFVKTIDSFYF